MIVGSGDDVYLSPADAEPFAEALREAAAVVQAATPTPRVPHTPWCTDHQYGGKWPEDGFCLGEKVTIAGIETYLSGDYGKPCDISVLHGNDLMSAADVEQLVARLRHLVQQACTPETDYAKPRLNIEGFFRVGADDRSTSFDTLHDPDRLMRQLRRDHGVCGRAEANPVVILTEPDDRPGEHQGAVAVASDDKYFATIDRAFRCLEAVRAGLLEAGHTDD